MYMQCCGNMSMVDMQIKYFVVLRSKTSKQLLVHVHVMSSNI